MKTREAVGDVLSSQMPHKWAVFFREISRAEGEMIMIHSVPDKV